MRGKSLRTWLGATGIALALLGTGHATEAVVPPARDPDLVLAEVYDRALAAQSNAALILFIARYPDAPLTDAARKRLRARIRPDPTPPGGTDGRIIAEFDAARLAGSPAALDAFAARHPRHPLAAEARRPYWRN